MSEIMGAQTEVGLKHLPIIIYGSGGKVANSPVS